MTSPDGRELVEHRRLVVGDAAGSTSDSQADAGSARPASCSIDAATPSTAAAAAPPTCCQPGRNRPSVAGSTGSTSLRSAARSGGGGGEHAGCRTTRCRAAAAGTRLRPRAIRPRAGRAHRMTDRDADAEPVGDVGAMNGPWVRAKRATRSPSGSANRLEERSAPRAGAARRARRAAGGVLDGGQPLARRRYRTSARDRARLELSERQPRLRRPRRRHARASLVASSAAEQSRSRSATSSTSRARRSSVEPLELALDLRRARPGRAVRAARPRRAARRAGRVESERGGPALGQRAVALVDERRDVAEEQGAARTATAVGLDLDEP